MRVQNCLSYLWDDEACACQSGSDTYDKDYRKSPTERSHLAKDLNGWNGQFSQNDVRCEVQVKKENWLGS